MIRREGHDYGNSCCSPSGYPGQALAPTMQIDQIWHLRHDAPARYYEDCMRLFGQILDHDGGFGHDPAELPELKATFNRTAELWEKEFGEKYVEREVDPNMTNCWHDCSGRCWHACKSHTKQAELVTI